MKIRVKIESESGWNINDLKEKYTNPEGVFEKDLIDFINKLPTGDYSDILEQYYNDDLMVLRPINKK